MTNEEAIKEIRQWIKSCPFPETKEAFHLAIMALNHEVYWEDVNQALNGWLNNTTSQNTALNDIYRACMGRGESTKPRGKWSDESNDSMLCSACGKRVYKPFIGGFPTERTSHYYPNFCAFCGADMRGAE